MKPRITVRDATPDDVEVITDYNCRLAEESEGKNLNRATLARGIQRGLDSPGLCRYFVAEADGEVVATTMITFELTDWRCGVLWWLQSVYVEPAYRRHGVFRAIYRHIESCARESEDVRGIRLYVKHDNDKARTTYSAVGMTPAGYDVYEHDWSGAVSEAD